MVASSHSACMKQGNLANALGGFLGDHATGGCVRLLWNQRAVRAKEMGYPEWRDDSTYDERTSHSGLSSQVRAWLAGGVS